MELVTAPVESGQPAPAPVVTQPEAPVSEPASHVAARQDSTTAYREARRAERLGKPLADVPVVPKAEGTEAPVVPAQTPERRTKPADIEADERLRTRVANAVKPLQAEIARLQQQLGTRTAPAKEPPAPAEPAWKRYAAMPDAPKLAAFESVEEHTAAMAAFVGEQMFKEHAQTAQRTEAQRQMETHLDARVSDFDARIAALKATDPDIEASIMPVAQELSQRGGPYIVVRETVIDSPLGPQLLKHFKEHPEALQRIVALPDRLRSMPLQVAAREHGTLIVREIGKLEAQLEAAATPPAGESLSPAIPLTRLPAPPLTLGSKPSEAVDPMTAAVKSGSTSAYRQLRRQERLASMRR